MPIFKVHQSDGGTREVEVNSSTGTTADLLETIFVQGQNDVCIQGRPSVSPGDVIELLDGSLYMVMSRGFQVFPTHALDTLAACTPEQRRVLARYDHPSFEELGGMAVADMGEQHSPDGLDTTA
jgi:hypothetical protein